MAIQKKGKSLKIVLLSLLIIIGVFFAFFLLPRLGLLKTASELQEIEQESKRLEGETASLEIESCCKICLASREPGEELSAQLFCAQAIKDFKESKFNFYEDHTLEDRCSEVLAREQKTVGDCQQISVR